MAARTQSRVTAKFQLGLVILDDEPDFRAAADSILGADGICRLQGLCTLVLSIEPEPIDATLVYRVVSDRTCSTATCNQIIVSIQGEHNIHLFMERGFRFDKGSPEAAVYIRAYHLLFLPLLWDARLAS